MHVVYCIAIVVRTKGNFALQCLCGVQPKRGVGVGGFEGSSVIMAMTHMVPVA